MDADHVGYAPSPVVTSRAWATFGMTEAQPADDLRTQLAARHGVDGGVDGFVRNSHRRMVRMHGGQCASNLLGRVARLQLVRDVIPQRVSRLQAAKSARLNRTRVSASMRNVTPVATR